MNKLMTTLAAGVALIGAASVAQAAPPAVSARFYVSGASAARAVTPLIAANDLCQAATVKQYDYSVNAKNYNVTFCTLKTTAQDGDIPASLSGVAVAIHGRADGGSMFGLKPLLSPQPIRFINEATCTTDPVGPYPHTTNGLCTALSGTDFVSGEKPDLGITDEEPNFLAEVHREVGNQVDRLTAAERNNLSSLNFVTTPAYQVVWTLTAGSTFPVSNISRDVARAIFTGNYTTVKQVMIAMGLTPTGVQLTDGLEVCVRDNNSGTMSGHMNMWAGTNYCGTGPGPVLTSVNETNDGGSINTDDNLASPNYDVRLNSSSGNLEACIRGAQNPTPPVADVLRRSIGINSLENAGIADIKELSIDGVAPTLANAARGQYPFYSESAINYNVTQQNDGTITRSTTTQRADFAALYIAKASQAGPIAASGLNGLLAFPYTGGTPDDSFAPSNPVSYHSRGGNSCNTPAMLYP